MLDKLFEKVYVITTVDSERIDYVKQQMKKAKIKDYEFHVTFDNRLIRTDIESAVGKDIVPQRYISATYGTISLLKAAVFNGYKNVCICEDDIFFGKGWEKKLQKFMDNVPKEWDILNLGYANEIDDTSEINEYVKMLWGRYYGNQCVVYKNTCYHSMVEAFYQRNCNLPPDWLPSIMSTNKFGYKVYIPKEHFIFQASEDYAGKERECKAIFKSLIHIPSDK